MHTVVLSNKPASGHLMGGTYFEVGQYTLILCLGQLTLFKCNDFLSDPIPQTTQFRAESRNNALSHGTSLPVSPGLSSGSYVAGGWVAGGDGDGG